MKNINYENLTLARPFGKILMITALIKTKGKSRN
jgi:hypothetical protein